MGERPCLGQHSLGLAHPLSVLIIRYPLGIWRPLSPRGIPCEYSAPTARPLKLTRLLKKLGVLQGVTVRATHEPNPSNVSQE